MSLEENLTAIGVFSGQGTQCHEISQQCVSKLTRGKGTCSFQQPAKVQVVQTYTGHGSISYGADWFRGGALEDSRGEETQSTAASAASTTNVNLAATCSFYDRLLHLWSPQVPS
eukprot:1158330-Pelagomonas_calceolata.AAC.1